MILIKKIAKLPMDKGTGDIFLWNDVDSFLILMQRVCRKWKKKFGAL